MKSFLLVLIIVFTTMNFVAQDNITSLHYLVKHPKIENENTPLIILLHGVGSNEKDLFSFADELAENYLVISARAPLTLGQESYGWYQLDFSNGKPLYDPKQAEASRLLILKFIEELKNKFTFNHRAIYLCGFSQGGIMAYSVGLSNPDKIKGIAVMSGRLLDETKTLVEKEKVKKLDMYISHGNEDPVLGIHYAREALQYLKAIGLNPTYKEYKAGHSINQNMLLDLISWLK